MMRFNSRTRECLLTLIFVASSPASAQSTSMPPATHHVWRRVGVVVLGVAVGGTSGYLVGRHLARQPDCAGCATSTNHDGYLGGGLALGASVGGLAAWYITRPRPTSTVQVRRAGYLTGAEADKRAMEAAAARPHFMNSLAP